MTAVGERELLGLISDAWPELTKDLRVNNCILCVRTAIEVAQYFGFTWTPLPVDVAVFNEAGWAGYTAQVPISEWGDEAWSLGVVCSNEVKDGADWDGHLIIRANAWVADLSTEQFDRPAKGIHLDPWSLPTVDQTPPWGFEQNGIFVYLSPRADIDRYRSAPDWQENYKDLAAVLIKEVKRVRDSD